MKSRYQRVKETNAIIIALELVGTAFCLGRPCGHYVYVPLTAASIIIMYAILIRFMLSFSKENKKEWRPISVTVAFTSASIISIIILFSNLLRWSGLKGDCVTHNLGISVYTSIITITTVGYGDFHPYNAQGRVITSFEALSGYVTFGILVASLANMLRVSNSERLPK